MELAWFSILLLLAEIAGTVGGFGSSMLVMPLAGEFLPFEQALGLTAVFHVFSNGAKMVLFRKGLSRELLWSLGVPAVLGVLIGARLTLYLNERILLLMLGALLVILSAGLWYAPDMKVRPTRSNAVVGGGISGLVAGLVGTGGAIRGITLAAFGLEKNAFVATSAWIDMGVDLSRSVMYTAQGYMNEKVWLYLPGLAAISVAGTWIGRRYPRHHCRTRFPTRRSAARVRGRRIPAVQGTLIDRFT